MFGSGDIVIAAVWPHETAPRPATRWVLKRERLPEAEDGALTGLMVQHVLAISVSFMRRKRKLDPVVSEKRTLLLC
jgi:hypothetical protein